MVKVTLKKSMIGRNPQQVKTLKAMGLTKVGRVSTLPDNDAVRGMIAKVQHLVEVEK